MGAPTGLDCSFPQCFVHNKTNGALQLIAAPKMGKLCITAAAGKPLVVCGRYVCKKNKYMADMCARKANTWQMCVQDET